MKVLALLGNGGKHMKKTLICLLLCLSLVAAVPVFATEPDPQYSFGSWNETIWVEIPGLADADVTAVSYTGPVTGSLTGQDLEFLVRDTDAGVRIDIPGLPVITASPFPLPIKVFTTKV